MKALRFHQFGPPSVLSIEEIADPRPRGGEALVRVKAAAINPSDVGNVSGRFKDTTLPRTPGRDFAGTVIEGNARRGEAVWGSAPALGIGRDGTHAEYVAVPVEILSKVPANLSMEQAAAIGVPYTTAWAALVQAAQVQPGETILIVGARGAVGQAATQIAKWKKTRVIGAALGAAAIPGAAAAVDTTAGDFRERVLEITGGRGVDVVFDTVGGHLFEPSLRSLAWGGRQVAISSTGERRVTFDLVDFYHNGSHLIGVDSQHFTPTEVGEMAREFVAGFESDALKPPVIEPVPFEDALKAYEKVAGGQAKLKQVLIFS
jgi:NADPH:quinone reductase-like Zn-dependent oxidoreductase